MTSSSPATSLTLLDRLRLPDQPDAWARFVRLYTPLLRDWVRRQGFQEADVEDLTQEVLVKLMTELPRYSRQFGQSFRGWLYRVTAHQCIDFRRRRATRKLPGADGLSAVGEESPLSDFVEADYRRALVRRGLELIRADFNEQTWTVFEQVMVSGRAVAEVAAELHITSNAVYLAQNRVLTRLRQEVEEFLD